MKRKIQFIILFIIFSFFLIACERYQQSVERLTISFETFSAEEIQSLRIDRGNTIEVPTLMRVGYTFHGWFLDIEFNVAFNVQDPITTDLVLYAKWVPLVYELTIDYGFEQVVLDIPFETEIDIPPFILAGYKITGWYEDEALTIPFEVHLMPNQDLIIYAKWEKVLYHITFDSVGGEPVSSLSYYYEDTIQLPNATKIGHTFEGWYLEPQYDHAIETFMMPANDLTLYAKWSINEYILKFDSHLDIDMQDQVIQFGDSIIFSPPLIEGHTFIGWYLDFEYEVSLDFDFMPAYDLTIYAYYVLNEYTISFETFDGDVIESVHYEYLAEIEPLPFGQKTGHTFIGWFLDNSFKTPFEYTQMPDENLVLYAKFDINSYHISFVTYGGELIDQMTMYYHQLLNLPESSKFGYDFEGWYVDEQFEQMMTELNMPAYDLILHAKFTPIMFSIQYYVQSSITDAALGTSFTISIAEDQNVYVFGRNNYGQLGLGHQIDQFEPVQITKQFNLEADEFIVSVANGIFHSIALSSQGRVFTWGGNLYGQLGNGTTTSSSIPQVINSYIPLINDEEVIQIKAGAHHNVLLTNRNRVFVFGINNNYELGLGTKDAKVLPTLLDFSLNDDFVVSIVDVKRHTILKTAQNHYYGFGDNINGQLGLNHQDVVTRPVRLFSNFAFEIEKINVGRHHTLLLTTDGTLYGVGLNDLGQLASLNLITPVLTQIDISFLNAGETIINIFANANYSMVLTSEHRLFAFGENNHGQLGDGTKANRFIPVEVSSSLPLVAHEFIEDLFLGFDHVLAITSLNRIITFGSSSNGQLGSSIDMLYRTPILFRLEKTVNIPYETIIPTYIFERSETLFAGWYLDDAFEIKYEEEFMPAFDLILYEKLSFMS
jgi:uncharacterized repeat protein (TIGR02543 family)